MAQEATVTRLVVHATELIEVSGATAKGRELTMFLGPTSVTLLRQVFQNERVTGHLGHAYWHAKNPDAAMPCDSCSPVHGQALAAGDPLAEASQADVARQLAEARADLRALVAAVALRSDNDLGRMATALSQKYA